MPVDSCQTSGSLWNTRWHTSPRRRQLPALNKHQEELGHNNVPTTNQVKAKMALVESSTTPISKTRNSQPRKNRGRVREFLFMCLPQSNEKNYQDERDGSDSSFRRPLAVSSTTVTGELSASNFLMQSARFVSRESISRETDETPLNSPVSSPMPPPLFQCSYQLRRNQYFKELGYMQFDCQTVAEAQPLALASGKPVLAIETRIPGDSDAGTTIFSHPLVVEACQSLFISVVHSIGEEEEEEQRRASMGKGAVLVQRAPSGKPCRTKLVFLDPRNGAFLAEPLYGDKLTLACLAWTMVHVQEQWSSRSMVPKYLSLLCEEEMGKVDMNLGSEKGPRQKDYHALFATEDSASCEVEFACLDGVFATRAVFIAGRRGVEISYDSTRVAYCSLVRHALKRDMATVVYFKTNDEKRAAEVEIARIEQSSVGLEKFEGGTTSDYIPKRALRKTPLRFVPMLDIQATRANRLVHLGRFDEAMHLLSPRQGAILMHAMRVTGQKLCHEVIDVPITVAWVSMSERHYPSEDPKNDEEQLEWNPEDLACS